MSTTAIYRYDLEITDRPVVEMPRGALVLSHPPGLRNQDSIEIWAVVNPEAPLERRAFLVVGTGNPMPEVHGPFVGSVVTHGGSAVWHVFEADSAVRASLRAPDGSWR